MHKRQINDLLETMSSHTCKICGKSKCMNCVLCTLSLVHLLGCSFVPDTLIELILYCPYPRYINIGITIALLLLFGSSYHSNGKIDP